MAGNTDGFKTEWKKYTETAIWAGMASYPDDEFAKLLDQHNIEGVRAALDADKIHFKNLQQALEWVAKKESERADAQSEKERLLREREIAAAEVSAAAAQVSASEAQRNSRIAMAAAFIAAVAAIISAFKS